MTSRKAPIELTRNPIVKAALRSRWPQFIMRVIALAGFVLAQPSICLHRARLLSFSCRRTFSADHCAVSVLSHVAASGQAIRDRRESDSAQSEVHAPLP